MKTPEVLIVQSHHKPGSLASILQVIADANIVVEGLHAVQRDHIWTMWEITVEPEENSDLDTVVRNINALENAKILGRSDRVFEKHQGGKIDMVSRLSIDSDESLRDLYTPGVARVCLAIQERPQRAKELTSIHRTVAIVTNGTAILGLGPIGAVAGMPVMEGKAALFHEFVELSGIPILIESDDPDTIVEAVAAISPSFGAIQLEDIRAPECFEIEERLIERLDIPVMHDDQHGTGVVALAAILGATEHANIDLTRCVVGQIGLGAAGLGISRLLLHYGVANVLGSDLDPQAIARFEAAGGQRRDLAGIMAEAEVVVATTGVRGLIPPEMIRKGQVILALSNPDPEIDPEVALQAGAAYAADGRVVNNVLGFPGIFKGALDADARKINRAMLVAAAEELASLRARDALVPNPLDRSVHTRVAHAVARAAREA